MYKRITNDPKNNIYIAPSADVMGDVIIGENSSIWYQALVRGDNDQIIIGKNTNIQDGCVLHPDPGYPIHVGNNVTVGHNVILHGCTIGDNTLVGMGAIVLNGAKVGKNCIIGAGALVTGGTVIPDGMMALGSPEKVKRPLREDEILGNLGTMEEYLEGSKKHFG